MKRFLVFALLLALAVPAAEAAQTVYSHHYSNTANATSAAPAGTTSTTGVVMGLGGAVTPLYTGAILLMVSGDITNSTGSDGAKVQLYYGTGRAPSNATACSSAGTTRNAVGLAVQQTPVAAAATKIPFHVHAIVTGLTVGTAYWFDACLTAITGGTASIADVTVSAAEL
jgi:hypothetical protein